MELNVEGGVKWSEVKWLGGLVEDFPGNESKKQSTEL